MTVPIEYPPITATSVVTPGSRYRDQTVIYYGERRFLTFATYVRKPYVPSGSERVMVVTKGLEYRPDLASHDFYGFPDNWWRILEANGMSDVYEFKAGKTVILPNPSI